MYANFINDITSFNKMQKKLVANEANITNRNLNVNGLVVNIKKL